MYPISEQPKPAVMASTRRPAARSTTSSDVCGAGHHHHHGGSSHKACHYARLRRLLIPAILVLLTTTALLFLEFADFGAVSGAGAGGDLFRRASGSTVGSGQDQEQGFFVKNKLYLVIVIAGLILALVAAIMLSFCCCKNAFENPLCCPCYLCACCGGLACLECISCGLCAAGADDFA